MKLLTLLLLPGFLLAQDIQITPSQPYVNQGGTVIISTDRPAYFSVLGAGWVDSQEGTSTTYHAQAAADPVRHSLNGCLTAPTNSVFNTRIDTLPASANSDAWTAGAMIVPISVIYQWGTNVTDNGQPLTPSDFYYTSALNGTAFPAIAPGNKKRETGADTTDGVNDHHMLVLNRQSCQLFETYQQGDFNAYCPACTAASGWTYRGTDAAQPQAASGGTTDAAGMPLAPLTLHMSELQDGAVNHALRFTACNGCIGDWFMWPAISSTGSNPNAAPMGTRFRLKADFDISSFPAAARVVLTALKQYGMFLTDIGITGQISASTDVTEDPEIVRELQSIQTAEIGGSNFEAVNEGSLMLSPALNVVSPFNGWTRVPNSALLAVMDASDPADYKLVPIVLQPVMVGTPDPLLTVQAGTNPFPIPAWVNGSDNQAVSWSISPASGAGSISASGVYTAPTSVSGLTKALVTATSAADPNATASVQIMLLPGGTLRIDSGSDVATQDENGFQWLADIGFETGSYNNLNDNYPVNAWGAIPNVVQTQTYKYTWGDDILYRFHVPDGWYNVTMTVGVGDCVGGYYRGNFDNGLILGPLNVELQGQTVLAGWDMGPGVNYACRAAQSITLPAYVNDTNLKLALRATGGDYQHSVPLINALMIAPAALPGN